MSVIRACACGLDAHDRRQELVVDPDPRQRVLGDVAVVRDDERDRLTGVVDLVPGQRVLGAAVGQRGVRDQQRQRLGHRARQVVVGPDEVDALDVEHPGDVDVGDPRVGVRRAEHGRVQRTRDHVVDVAALSAQHPVVLDAGHLGAHQLGGHGVPSVMISAARSTALTMFW